MTRKGPHPVYDQAPTRSSTRLVTSAVQDGDADGRKLKTSEKVAVMIVRDIVAGGMKTGDRLPLEAAMLEQYGVSRASLREALRLLEVQGLITIRPGPHGGPVVGAVNAANLAHTATLYFHLGAFTYRDLFDAQIRLEPDCAEMAASQRDRLAVRRSMEPFLAPNGLGAVSATRNGFARFHHAVYGLAGQNVITLLARTVNHVVTEHVLDEMDPVELRPAIHEEHRALAQAIIAGRAADAARLTEAHFRRQREYYERRWASRLDSVIEWR